MQHISGLHAIIDQYDVFLIDQFGVLHDGTVAYPASLDALEFLRQRGKTVVVLSNSGKRSSVNIARLQSLGFAQSGFDHVVTSGDVAHAYLSDELSRQQHQYCYFIARDSDTSAIDGLDVAICYDIDKADFIVISGSKGDEYTENYYREILASAAAKRIPCVCSNPDKKMLTPQGLRFGAGRIAEIYEECGGSVHWIGKPHRAIYDYSLKLFPNQDRSRILCIGDSVEHDMVGAKSVSLSALLVRSGINKNTTLHDLKTQCEHYQVQPEYISDVLAV